MSDPNNFVLWNITSVTDNDTYYTFGVDLTDEQVFLGTMIATNTYGFIFELIVPDATTSKKGIVKLAGDLTGTADLPTIKASVNLTGVPTAQTASLGANTTQLATTAFVTAEITNRATPDATTLVKGKVQLAGDLTGTAALPTIKASVNLTGIPTANTASPGTNTTQLATTAFVLSNSINIPFLNYDLTDKTVWNNGFGDNSYNTSFGEEVLKNNTTGYNNTGIGYFSLVSNTTGTNNTANGPYALNANVNGSNNAAFGPGSLAGNISGDNNAAFGGNTLGLQTVGSRNSALGFGAFENLEIGDDNIAIGYNSGWTQDTINQSVLIGTGAEVLGNNQINQIVIGYNAIGNGSNTGTYGNSSITDNYFSGNIIGDAFVKNGGISSEYLMADGSTTLGAALPYLVYTANVFQSSTFTPIMIPCKTH